MSELRKMTIHEAIPHIMAEIGAIGKNSRNTQQGFMYRGIDDVMNALNPLMAKYGVYCVPEVLEQTREERQTRNGGNLVYSILRTKYTFYASDGSNVSAVVVGEGMDSGDKASNKAMAIAMKYVMFQTFCIPTVEMKGMDDKMDDPDAETHEITPKAKPVETTPAATTDPRTALVNEYIKEHRLTRKEFAEELARHTTKPAASMTADELTDIINQMAAE